MRSSILTARKQLIACLLLTVILQACGGGGQASASASPPTSTPPPATGTVVTPPSDPPEGPNPLHVDGEDDPVTPPVVDVEPTVPQVPGNAADFAIRGYGPARIASVDEAASFATSDASVAKLAQSLLLPTSVKRLYVSPKGSDSNPGTLDRPLRSIAKAAQIATAGTRVLVAPGDYTGPIRSSASGRADARLVFVSTTKWGARIAPPASSTTRIAWDNRGSHVDIVGFEVDGSGNHAGVLWTHGIYSAGSFDSIRNNWVHHIAQKVTCSRAGGAAIGIDSYYRGTGSEVVANLVHDIGPAACRYVQGIYVSTPGSVKNNVVYRVAEAGIHLWHDARDVVISNNTVTDSHSGIIVGGGDFYHSTGPNDRTQVFSNIVVNNTMGISEQGRTGSENSYNSNLVFANTRYNWNLRNGLLHRDTISEAPQLINSAGHGGPALRPNAASPAVGRGNPVHAESTDFEGRPRTAREGYDIGAFQH